MLVQRAILEHGIKLERVRHRSLPEIFDQALIFCACPKRFRTAAGLKARQDRG